jgi:hypothetical protein
MNISDLRLRLRCARSREARAAGRKHSRPVLYSGSLGPDVYIEYSSGETESAPTAVAAVPDYRPCFRSNYWRVLSPFGIPLHVPENDPLVMVNSDVVMLLGIQPGVHPFRLPTTGFNHGHELTVIHNDSPAHFFTIDGNGAGAILPAKRLLKSGASMKLVFDTTVAQWKELVPPAGLSRKDYVDVPALAAGAISSELAFTLSGASVGMVARIVPVEVDLGSDLEICAVRPVAGEVRFRVRNLGASPIDPVAREFRASAGFEGA